MQRKKVKIEQGQLHQKSLQLPSAREEPIIPNLKLSLQIDKGVSGKISQDQNARYSKDELKFLETCFIEQSIASGCKIQADQFDAAALIEVYRQRGAVELPKFEKKPVINQKVKVMTWIWDSSHSHKLFNFGEEYNLLPDVKELIGTHIISKQGPKDVLFQQVSKLPKPIPGKNPNKDRLVNFIYDQGRYYLFQPSNPAIPMIKGATNIIENYLWLIAKYMPKGQLRIEQDCVIRFGRIPFKVAKIRLPSSPLKLTNRSPNYSVTDSSVSAVPNDIPGEIEIADQEEPSNDLTQTMRNISNIGIQDPDLSAPKEELAGIPQLGDAKVKGGLAAANISANNDERLCRICLESTEIAINPFITPCKCSGSLRLIHLDCLKEWLNSKKQSQYHDGIFSYYWEELSCELCKSPLQLQKVTKGDIQTLLYLLTIEQPDSKCFCILESDIACLSKAIHVVDFSVKYMFNVGRRVTNDITVSDISVSRQQALMKYDSVRNCIYLEDCDSKFGTFKKINGLYPIDQVDQVIPIQVEKKAFFMTLQNRWSCAQKCMVCFYLGRDGEYFDHFIDHHERFPDYVFFHLHKNEYCRFRAQALSLHLIERQRMARLLTLNEQKNTISNSKSSSESYSSESGDSESNEDRSEFESKSQSSFTNPPTPQTIREGPSST